MNDPTDNLTEFVRGIVHEEFASLGGHLLAAGAERARALQAAHPKEELAALPEYANAVAIVSVGGYLAAHYGNGDPVPEPDA